ncbi:MAG: DEAD/DEAH box helicase family protein [Gammaproteobacteria bacterium]|nr:DEAD/DEAH box helicase family protein [Gammaproteobacteria bacterium]
MARGGSARRTRRHLQDRLVLHGFVCGEFGYADVSEMLDRLRDVPAGFAGEESEFARALYLNPARARVTPREFADYDANIMRHTRRLRMTEQHGRAWKPHQYVALLLTECYLHRYFHDMAALRDELNAWKGREAQTRSMPDYTLDDLRTLAFQSATGSGKTYLMHAHILQYRQWLASVGGRLNNVVLLTPNEQMSAQHERDLEASGIRGRVFSNEAGADILEPVEIIDLNKLAEKKGVKRVAVRDFGENNLVLVDEGHLGASGRVWRERRGELGRGGFTFEYSATFNQVTSANNEDASNLCDAYAKCLLFDYSYRRFYDDGYGKDYDILNLPHGMRDENSDTYLLGCLLTFYQQCRLWRDNRNQWSEFNLVKPLWVFLGKTVTGASRADKATRSDVAVIVGFLGWVLAHRDSVEALIDSILNGQSGLTDDGGNDYFANRFDYLKGDSPQGLYDDICTALFHGSGRLHVVYLTSGEGELHLRSADNPVFGVVNVGDSPALYRMLAQHGNPDLDVDREPGFAERLFDRVDEPDSNVNVVIGARRFIAGWNSWRVGTMGLMHVGVGEGPEIIQMFGRGVRLKGWRMSLKRHRRNRAEPPADSDALAELERLHIFGLRASYMQTFRDLLEAEGVRAQRETIQLPVTWNFAKTTELKLVRLPQGVKYECSEDRAVLPSPGEHASPRNVTLDLYSKIQGISSDGFGDGLGDSKNRRQFEAHHKVLFDRVRIQDKLLKRKQVRGWHNLVITPEVVESLLERDDWYGLYVPSERLDNIGSVSELRALEDIAVDLISEYADEYWRTRRRQWEHDKLEVVTLDEDDPNSIGAYELSVDVSETRLVEAVRELADDVRRCDYHLLRVGAILTKAHAYEPLLYAGRDSKITVRPVALDENEKIVVKKLADLAECHDSCLLGRELYLIRNLTRGRGVSFFDDFAYYPDFIVWLKDAENQHVMFLDPKGLSRYGGKERRKVGLHTGIAEVEERIRNTDNSLRLHAYVLSVTSAEQIDDGRRSATEWKEDGVYFLDEPDCLKQVIEHALDAKAA